MFQWTLAQPLTVFTWQRQKPEDFCSADQYLKHTLISNLGVNFLALRNALDINFHLAWCSLYAEHYDREHARISSGETISSSDFKTATCQGLLALCKRHGSMKYLCLRQ